MVPEIEDFVPSDILGELNVIFISEGIHSCVKFEGALRRVELVVVFEGVE